MRPDVPKLMYQIWYINFKIDNKVTQGNSVNGEIPLGQFREAIRWNFTELPPLTELPRIHHINPKLGQNSPH